MYLVIQSDNEDRMTWDSLRDTIYTPKDCPEEATPEEVLQKSIENIISKLNTIHYEDTIDTDSLMHEFHCMEPGPTGPDAGTSGL